MVNGMSSMLATSAINPGGGSRFSSEPSDPGLSAITDDQISRSRSSSRRSGFQNINMKAQQERPYDFAMDLRDKFVGGREAPYFPDVTNRVLRMENREKEAVRALGKINQERFRRSQADTASTNPMAWGPFWKEWKQTHPMDGEKGYGLSGFQNDRDSASYESQFSTPY
jgi:hypothetical protein